MKNLLLKFSSSLLVLILIFSCSFSAYGTENTSDATEEPSCENGNTDVFNEDYFGDIDQNGKITATDARVILRACVGLEETTENILLYGDMNSDKEITSDDARTVLRISVGLDSIKCILRGHEIISVKIKATCTKEGYTEKRCKDCSYKSGEKTDIVHAKGHTLKKSIKKATCTTDGTETVYCTVCSYKEKPVTTEKAQGHSFSYWEVNDNSKSKTCKKCSFKITSDKAKSIYLTFDDGPGPYTEKLLGYLKEYNVKATFFVTNQMPRYKSLIKKIAQDGHALGVHTLTHQWSIYSSKESYLKDFNAMHKIIEDETGIDTKIFRFPGGTNNTVSRSYSRGIMSVLSKTMTEKGYRYYDWNIDCCDTLGYSSSKIASTTINQLKNRKTSIVLMHDIKNTTVEAVKSIIEFGLNNGYEFMVIDESTPPVRFSPVN